MRGIASPLPKCWGMHPHPPAVDAPADSVKETLFCFIHLLHLLILMRFIIIVIIIIIIFHPL